MIDSFLLIIIFVFFGFLVCLFLAYFPYKTIWYDKKHGLKHTITDNSITTEWDFQSPLTLLKMLSSFIQCEDDEKQRNKFIRQYNRLKEDLKEKYDVSDFPEYKIKEK